MGRFLVHGLAVETASSLGWDPGAELLAGFPGAQAGATDLRIQVERGPVPAPATDGEVVLLQPGVRAVLVGGEVRVETPGALGRVPLRGDRIDLLVGGDVDRHAVAQVHLFLALAAALRLRGWIHLHAACTLSPDGAPLLVAGQSGSGKSTLCLALVAAGHRYLGDDVVFWDAAAGRLLAFPRPFHLGPEAARAVPEAAARLGERYGVGEKRALDASAAFPGRALLGAGAPRVLLFPSVARGAALSRLTALTPVEAVAELVESSAFVAARLPGHRAQLTALAALADGAAAWRVALGADLLNGPLPSVRRLLATVGVHA